MVSCACFFLASLPLHWLARVRLAFTVPRLMTCAVSYRNPGGVRFGSAELYDVLDASFKPGPSIDPAHIIEDYLAVGQAIAGGTDERVILFIKLQNGFECSDDLRKRIKTEIRKRRTARHVPDRVSRRTPISYLRTTYASSSSGEAAGEGR